VLTRRAQPSPCIDLDVVRQSGGAYLTGRSANTRQQLRRSDRSYERHGPIRLQPAVSVASAHAMLDQMADLHQATWQARGKPGSFAIPFFRRFHRALIATALPRGEVVLLKAAAGETLIGYLYNFLWCGRMSAYQSGFAYPGEARQAKPGLTCHLAAIRDALARGLHSYDFLAGDGRYKQSLANQSHNQFWLEAGPLCSPRLLSRTLVGRLRSSSRSLP
jgi:CelD/BcsL family acetyltransferase involved in cellulose biosynthesis